MEDRNDCMFICSKEVIDIQIYVLLQMKPGLPRPDQIYAKKRRISYLSDLLSYCKPSSTLLLPASAIECLTLGIQ